MKNIPQLLQQNWKSGLTVALVSIPMSVSLAVASGTTPVVGIITAMWAGLIASIFGSSKFNIVGPAGALSGILAADAMLFGAENLPMLAVIAGVFIFLSYLLKLERYLTFIPASTVHGFTLGVGLILALGQLNFAFGLTNLTKHSEAIKNIIESLKHLPNLDTPTTLVFAAFLVVLFLFLKYVPKLPGAVVLTPIGILLGYLSTMHKLPFEILTLGSKFPTIKAALFVPHSFTFTVPLLVAALTVAAVGILETMLCGKIADGMADTKHNRQREMFALSMANIGSGVMGGLPATAVLARTALNVRTGATHRTSQGLNSICIFIISFIFLSFFKYIPLSVVAAILVFTAFRMIERQHFARMYHHDKKSFWIAICVAFVTIYWDPSIGILFGTAISLLLFVEKLSKGQYELVINDQNKKIAGRLSDEQIKEIPTLTGDTLVYSIKGQLAYINAQSHISRFENSKSNFKNVILRLRELYFVDLDGVDALEEMIELLEKTGKQVLITGANPLIVKELEESPVFRDLETRGKIFDRTSNALAYLGYPNIR